jgi:lipid A ethanolaminephosphotransferase
MMMWMSEGYQAAQEIEADCLGKAAQDAAFSHDNLFSTVLGAMDVSTSLYQQQKDILAGCSRPVLEAELDTGAGANNTLQRN